MEDKKEMCYEEIKMKTKNGWGMLFLVLFMYVIFIAGLVFGIILTESGGGNEFAGIPMIIGSAILLVVTIIINTGLRVLKPNEALVLTFFGKYVGSIKEAGFYYINPFCTAVNPAYDVQNAITLSNISNELSAPAGKSNKTSANISKKLSLKTMTLKNEKQKINDLLGNPIEIGVNVIWKISNTAKAVFNVDNYCEYLSTQADSALRNIVRLYPYDMSEEGDEKSLRGSAQEVAEMLKVELQGKVDIAGIEILEVRITHLAYAPEIAAAMLQRQQAVAIIEARQKIVEGAVGMVHMALDKLSENNVCDLDEERKAQMVSNLLVVLCGNKDAQPIVNSGSIY